MYFTKADHLTVRLGQFALALGALSGAATQASGASFGTPVVFATGSAVNGTAPDSVTYGNGSVWVEYGNNAPSTNYTGSGTIVQYSTTGSIQNTYSLAGSVDGLKYNPNTGLVWALQNQDANSQLSIIDPTVKTITSFTYGAPYTSVSSSRGFDDVAFIGNNVYLSQANPASTADPVVVKLTSSTPSSPVTMSPILTGVGVQATDPDSLKSTPTGGLVLTGEHDGALTFINNPGQANQTASSLKVSSANGTPIGSPDDSIYATAASGTFYMTDTSTNMVYALSATGLIPNTSLFVNVGDEFGNVDPSTGAITAIMSGTGLHGLEFVPAGAAAPEPATFGFAFAGFGIVVLALFRNRFAK